VGCGYVDIDVLSSLFVLMKSPCVKIRKVILWHGMNSSSPSLSFQNRWVLLDHMICAC